MRYMSGIRGMYRVVCVMCCMLLGVVGRVYGVDERYSSEPLRGSGVRVDSSRVVEDAVFFDPVLKPQQTTYGVRNLVTFSINESSGVMLPDSFSVTLQLRLYVSRVDGSGNLVVDSTTYTPYLTVGYNKNGTYGARSVYTLSGGYRLRVKILSVSSNVGNISAYEGALMVENEIVLSRDYAFTCTGNRVESISKDVTGVETRGELQVSWPKDRMADEYDLEWAYVDSSALESYKTSNQFDPEKIFPGNATRVSITREDYRIALLYDNGGTLFFRVRAVQLKGSGQRLEALWSSDNLANGLGSYAFGGHERLLNWQARTSYSEEGKRKSVVQYYDGSLRSRQTVTKDNTTDTTVVAETLYDHQGRPVIQVLPSPSLSSLIKYTPNFNTGLNGAEYDKTKYDGLLSAADYCASAAAEMSKDSGASRYYSPSNQNVQNGYHRFIPDAKGFPFTETRYTQDNTGRVSAGSGVGPAHQIGKTDTLYNTTHETRYYYGSADQEDLDALFGTEAGNASHYFKNMVRDANGQYSVSYMDMHGRTVATALAGKPRSSMDSLESGRVMNITKKLVDSASTIIKGSVMESSRSLVVTRAGVHSFSYSLNADSLRIAGCDAALICYDCLYDLRITISDDCNNKSWNGQPYVISASNFSLGGIDTVCNSPAGFTQQFNVFLEEGTYLITKSLSVSKSAMDYYRDSIYARRNTCRSVEDFVEEQKQRLRLASECEPSCASCNVDTLREWSLYRPYFMNGLGIAPADTASYRPEAWESFKDQREQCEQVCGNTGLHTSTRRQMLSDMTAPYGQYANPDSVDVHSIFSKNMDGRYRFTEIREYTDEDGRPSYISVTDADSIRPNDDRVSPQDFSDRFQESWADSLLRLHPEWCKLELYGSPSFSSSHLWDDQFGKVETFQQAKDRGYLNPTGITGFTFASIDSTKDPFFVASLNPEYGAIWRSVMNDSMYNKARVLPSGSYIDMWSLATAMAACDPDDESCFNYYKTNQHRFDIDTSCRGELDMAWRYFRQMYLDEKRDIISRILKQRCSTPSDLIELGHTLNFLDEQQLLPAVPGTAAEAAVAAADSITIFADANCRAYVSRWWQELEPCNYTTADTSVIFARLIGVCRQGSDLEHPYGSSTVRPSSGYAYRSFEEVISQYNDSLAGLPTPRLINKEQCNAYLITAPGAYGVQPFQSDLELWTKPDSGQCATISRMYQQYQSYGQGDNNFSAFLLRTTGVLVTQGALDTLRGLCNGTITCRFLTSPISLPPVLQSGVKSACATCGRVDSVYQSFRIAFAGVVPVNEDTDSIQQAKNRLFENYMNHNLGFELATPDYLNFMYSCNITASPPGSCSDLDSLREAYYQVDPAGMNHSFVTTLPNQVTIADTRQLFKNGVAQLPDEYRLQPGNFYSTFGQSLSGRTFCFMDSGYSVEYRIKMPFNTYNREIYYIATQSIGAVFTDENHWGSGNGTYLMGFYDDQGNSYGIAGSGAGFDYLLIDTAHGFEDFQNIKIKVARSRFYVYYNNTLVRDFPRDSTQPIVTYFSPYTAFLGNDGSVDWLKVYDSSDSLRFIENFEDSSRPVKPNPSDLCPAPPDCQVSFTNYFNQAKGTSYTYAQIDSMYLTNCGRGLGLCGKAASESPLLCGRGRAAEVFLPVTLEQHSACDDSTSFAAVTGTLRYEAYKDSLDNRFNDAYLAKCLNAYKVESFTVTQAVSEFHYTLYYYDQAGNLARTVPPHGMDMTVFTRPSYFDSVSSARRSGQVYVPRHGLATNYRYNTLNQVVAQHSPDAGLSQFWYDRLGRLVVSENAKQKAASITEENREYSYTRYDYLGRIREVGQVRNTAANGVMTDALSRNETSLNRWIDTTLAARKEQVTRTWYDLKYPGVNVLPLEARNLRNRVAYTTFTESASAAAFNQATFYSYDIHGNVDTLLQDYGGELLSATMNVMNKNQNRWKRISYRYDLISGKVNSVAYQAPYWNQVSGVMTYPADAFYHRYSYDAENRITLAETSADSVIWEREARYAYYLHGPLARTVLGDQLVQGMDYAYTLQGWLKGVNSTSLNSGYDMGEDGRTTGQNKYIARDVLGYSLNYYTGDYSAINQSVRPFPGYSGFLTTNNYKPLYNGNISSMSVNIGKLNRPLFYNYKYDQLNRITAMDAHGGLNQVLNNWDTLTAALGDFKERVSYDGGGNILSYLRQGKGSTLVMDSLSYKYDRDAQGKLISNRLLQVRDRVSNSTAHSANYASDIDDQAAGNYSYDAIGNLIKDNQEGITNITWNVYGKITEIQKSAAPAGSVSNIRYSYDASGNRISKRVQKSGSDSATYTWYVRDATGNVMAIYNSRGVNTAYNDYSLHLKEQHLYGSSRLGILKRNADQKVAAIQRTAYSLVRGNKLFELTNHLGNVLAVVSDRKVGQSSGGTTVDYYEAEVMQAQDYYPFGMQMPGRSGYEQRGETEADESGTSSLQNDLVVTSRTGNQPSEYKALNSITFDPDFESADGDSFEAFPTTGGSQGSGSGSIAHGWVDNSTSTGAFRYGFNGKENDNEVKGEGNSQDYGMRIYDPRLGRFLSVDPIASKYPMLTPYQFASNRPIDGIDLDGLEYLKAIYNITIKEGKQKVTANYVWFSSLTHSAHGNLGQGVNYEIKIKNLDNKSTTTNNYFVPRGGTGDYVTQYGNYMGSASLPNFNAYSGKKMVGTYRYDVPAVSQVDQLAKLHDQGYDRLGAVGAGGLFSDWGTTPYDEDAAKGWSEYLHNNKQGSKDPFTKLQVEIHDRRAASRGLALFNSVISNKKEAISNFMMQNYSDESKSRHSFSFSEQKKSDEYNYYLFLDKYMEKKDGNWIRKETMWNTDDKGNYTPKSSKTN